MTASFADLGVPSNLPRALEARGITHPFDVQAATIPDALAGLDVCGRAPTGSGKTIAFGIPLLARVSRAPKKRPTALILAPTRELAAQISRELEPLAQACGRSVFAVYGGVGLEPQRRRIARGVDVLVACPGRLDDLIRQRAVSLDAIEIVVIDEADRMADMGFLPAVKGLLNQTPEKRQTLLFSATLDGDVAVLTREYQHDAVKHDTGAPEPDGRGAHHVFWQVEGPDRAAVVADLVPAAGPTIVFCRTRRGADRLAQQLERKGARTEALHGGRSQNQRDRALAAFTDGRIDALVATDVAARGIHVDGVACVVHFDAPEDEKAYLHRSGRTARAGATGVVVSLVPHSGKRAVARLQRVLDLPNTLTKPDLDALTFEPRPARVVEPKVDRRRPQPKPKPNANSNRPYHRRRRPEKNSQGTPGSRRRSA